MHRKLLIPSFVFALCFISSTVPVPPLLAQTGAVTIHVATSGNDNQGNGSALQPYLTPERALRDVVQNRGDTICFHAGTYSVGLSLGIEHSGLTLTTCAGEQRATLVSPSTSSHVVYIYRADNATISNLRLIGPAGTEQKNAVTATESNNFHLLDAEIQGGYYSVKIDAYDGDNGDPTKNPPIPPTPPRHTTGATIQRCYIHDSDYDTVHTFNADGMTIEDSEMSNTGRAEAGNPDPNAQGIDVVGSLAVTVRRCYIHDIASSGIQIKGGSTNATVEQNRIVNSIKGSGILLGQDTDLGLMRNNSLYEAINSVARNNLVLNVAVAGLGAYSASNVRFYDNTVVGAAGQGQAGIWIVMNSREVHSRDVRLWNNIITVSSSATKTVFYQNLDTPIDSDYNLYFRVTGDHGFCREGSVPCPTTLQSWQQATGADTHSLLADPLLDSTNLYKPFPNSPAIDRGATIAEVTNDYSGGSRPQGPAYDIGAYEVPQACAVSPTAQSFPSIANGGSVYITGSGCNWTATSYPNWITINSGSSGTGNGTIEYTVAANASGARRTGSLSVAGQIVTISQAQQFTDVSPSDVYYYYISEIAARGVTAGCGGGQYCPDVLVPREQMAVFIERALGVFSPPAPSGQTFLDVDPSRWSYTFIEDFAKRGITFGCGGGYFCPDSIVPREQMATFLERAVGRPHPPVPATQRFVDVPSSNIFYGFIDSFVAHGSPSGLMAVIERGCNTDGQHFCPSNLVGRAEMAPLLVVAFGLTPGCQIAYLDTAPWQNTALTPSSGSFTVELDAAPLSSAEDTLVALSNGAQANWIGLAAIVRFNTNNTIDVRNGGVYQAQTTITYTPNTVYHIRMVVNVVAHTYSVYVTPQGGSELLLANNYAFRTEQQAVSSLNNWVIEAEIGSIRACNFMKR